MDKILVEGGRRLKGQVRISGAKNAALPILVSSLLTEGANTYSNVPGLKDVESIKLLLSNLGARAEVDLRGLRVDEVEGVLLPALDAAIARDLPSLRIIHGKGTGTLRRFVAELLRADGRARRFRLGAFEEGGSGVTVVELSDVGD